MGKPDVLDVLRDEYPGDKAWNNYVDAFRDARMQQARP